jgi:tetratricopeptide (TPR) repeat protein
MNAERKDPVVQFRLASSQANLALRYAGRKQFKEAEDFYGKALILLRALAADAPANLNYQQRLAGTQHKLGYLYFVTKRYAQAEKGMLDALAIRTNLLEKAPKHPSHLEDIVYSQANLAEVYRTLGKTTEAERSLAKALEVAEKLADAYPSIPHYRDDLAVLLNMQALFYQANGQPDQAATASRRSIEVQEVLVRRFPLILEYPLKLGGSYCNMGRRLRQNGEASASLEWFDKAQAQLQVIYKRNPKYPWAKTLDRNIHWNRAEALLELNHPAKALAEYDLSIDLSDEKDRPYLRLARALPLARLGKPEEAAAVAGKLGEPAGVDPYLAFDAARVFAAASESARQDDRRDASQRDKQARESADRAVKLLWRIHAEGHFKKAENIISLKRDRYFKALALHPEYQKLLAELTKR